VYCIKSEIQENINNIIENYLKKHNTTDGELVTETQSSIPTHAQLQCH